MNDPDNFAALGAIYENELRLVADQVWTRLSDNGPQPTSEIKLSLSESQLAQLNRDGEVTINLVESGFINLARQDVKLIEMGVEAVQSELSNSDSVQAANVQFRFEHEGRSIIQSGGTKYAFQHNANPNASSFYWSTDYDAIGGELTQSKISPSDIADAIGSIGRRPRPRNRAIRLRSPGCLGRYHNTDSAGHRGGSAQPVRKCTS